MLRLVSSARSRLLRAGAVRVAAVAVAPRSPRVAGSIDPFHRPCELLRFYSSSDAEGHDRPQRRPLVENNSVAWQEVVKPSLFTFLKLKTHLMVPVAFVVPHGDEAWPKAARTSSEWPEYLWDQYLGNKVQNIRQRGDFVEQVRADQEELERLNFRFGLALSGRKCQEKTLLNVIPDKRHLEELGVVRNDPESKWNERIMPAFETFHRLNGHCRVLRSFVVPSNERWPTLSWGLKLGIIVNGIRRGTYSTQVSRDRARLVELGFVWDPYEFDWSERIMPALETFHRLHGHYRVPVSFVVPLDENWPKLSWGLNLGSAVMTIRQGSYCTEVARSKTHLDELGFVWDVYKSEWRERILPALKAFYRVHGHCRVPAAFEVPAEAAWPEKFHGLELGTAVHTIRGGAYFDQIAREMDLLEAIEFDSRTPVTKKWEQRVEPMLATFEQLHGHRDVPRDFVVPSRSLWEKKDWGIQLGKLEQKEPLLR
ncbi:hypothetical protein PHYSODRAFT_341316 [Phytophthora sojae]|uniref:Helicase-associated domain-containing protein n=1 Tax=Phytophthora sojae (strain P6497) TaxID=1094619 RepID=G5ACR7_PHYSP|nr:hypothetical protein PHYSODRAFT_341316 [Phytophthora sojae]EGZ07141.1 hypothetical protein PHYSODRAFT_341316 [Phytophthora sojae]|eukprot:XP_009537905.1 hypothetical protein PHYSODRAFT_341316 [Phytophthora sojae]